MNPVIIKAIKKGRYSYEKEKELNQLATEHEIAPNMLRNWKKEFLAKASNAFSYIFSRFDKLLHNTKYMMTLVSAYPPT